MEQLYLPRGGNRQADSFATRLREVMTLVDKTQADLARETGINKGSISRYLSGQCEPKSRHLYLLAKSLNVNEWWLLYGDVRNMRFAEQTENSNYDTVKAIAEKLLKMDMKTLAIIKEIIGSTRAEEGGENIE